MWWTGFGWGVGAGAVWAAGIAWLATRALRDELADARADAAAWRAEARRAHRAWADLATTHLENLLADVTREVEE